MTYILTCGCESKYGGFPSEWDDESRECEPALSYGCLCDKHFGEYDARPAQYTAPRELSDEEIDRVVDETYGVPRNPGIYASHRRLARAILKKASEK